MICTGCQNAVKGVMSAAKISVIRSIALGMSLAGLIAARQGWFLMMDMGR
jgi:hypothetical protein